MPLVVTDSGMYEHISFWRPQHPASWQNSFSGLEVVIYIYVCGRTDGLSEFIIRYSMFCGGPEVDKTHIHIHTPHTHTHITPHTHTPHTRALWGIKLFLAMNEKTNLTHSSSSTRFTARLCNRNCRQKGDSALFSDRKALQHEELLSGAHIEADWGSRSINPLILNLGITCWWEGGGVRWKKQVAFMYEKHTKFWYKTLWGNKQAQSMGEKY